MSYLMHRRKAFAGGLPNHNWIVNFDATVGVYNTGTTDATDGQTVATWADQSTNGNDGTQATEANKPVFTASTFSNAGGVTFASGDFLDLTSTISKTTYQSYTFFGVVDRITNASSCWNLGGAAGTGSYPMTWFSDDVIYAIDNNGPEGFRETISGKNETGEHIITTQVTDGSAGGSLIHYDGADQADTRGLTTSGDSLYIGRRGSDYSDCRWGQILLTGDVLTAAEIDEVESYLSDKWSITIS